DVWFDSGAMPFAQWGYPRRGREEFEKSFPADFISEAIDQTRGWFHSMLWLSTLVFGDRELPHPYKSCMVLGHVADREGKKESKSKGNYTPPEIILDAVKLEFACVSPGEEVPAVRVRLARRGGARRGRGVDCPRGLRGDGPARRTQQGARLPRRCGDGSAGTRAAAGKAPAARDLPLPGGRNGARRPARRGGRGDPAARGPEARACGEGLGRGPEFDGAGRRRLPLVLLRLEPAVESHAPLTCRRARAPARASPHAAQHLRLLRDLREHRRLRSLCRGLQARPSPRGRASAGRPLGAFGARARHRAGDRAHG
ncbi:MAG: class I tRNA ligase family protein, partial [Deltaproteobacteria bacterium]|nr:class I tRNA ligase family protein [Deltaproteobacteria bacterium]